MRWSKRLKRKACNLNIKFNFSARRGNFWPWNPSVVNKVWSFLQHLWNCSSVAITIICEGDENWPFKEYNRIGKKIRPNTKSFQVPQLKDLEYKIRPDMVTLTLTRQPTHTHSMTLCRCKRSGSITKVEDLIKTICSYWDLRWYQAYPVLANACIYTFPG